MYPGRSYSSKIKESKMDIINILIAIAVIAGGIVVGFFNGSIELITAGIMAVAGAVLFFKELFKKSK
jgi:predicted Co/Zn/Cd cation transporter (cation efflux family)